MKSYLKLSIAALFAVSVTAAFTSCSSSDEPALNEGNGDGQPEVPVIQNLYTITPLSGSSQKEDIKSAFVSEDATSQTRTIAFGTVAVTSADELDQGDYTIEITYPEDKETADQSFTSDDKGYAAYLIDHKNKTYSSLKRGTLKIEADEKDKDSLHIQFRVTMDDDAIVAGEYAGKLTSAKTIDILPATNSFSLKSNITNMQEEIKSVDFKDTGKQYKFAFNYDEYSVGSFNNQAVPVLIINKELVNQGPLDLKTTKGWELNYQDYQAHEEKDPQWAPANTTGTMSVVQKADGTFRITYSGVTKDTWSSNTGTFSLSYEGEVTTR